MLNADLKEFEFASEFDELIVSAAIAVPMGEPNGIVQIVHGMQEHKERYYPFMDYLAEEGFITVIHDNRGHGKSICSEDDLGFMFRNGSEGFISDIAQINRFIHETYPQLPVFITGYGTGASGVVGFMKKNDTDHRQDTLCHSGDRASFHDQFQQERCKDHYEIS